MSVADPGGGVRGFNPHPQSFLLLLACQYMKISMDLDPNPPPPLSKNSGPEPPPPLEEFLDPPLHVGDCRTNNASRINPSISAVNSLKVHRV